MQERAAGLEVAQCELHRARLSDKVADQWEEAEYQQLIMEQLYVDLEIM